MIDGGEGVCDVGGRVRGVEVLPETHTTRHPLYAPADWMLHTESQKGASQNGRHCLTQLYGLSLPPLSLSLPSLLSHSVGFPVLTGGCRT